LDYVHGISWEFMHLLYKNVVKLWKGKFKGPEDISLALYLHIEQVYYKGTPLTSSKTISDKLLPLSSSSASASPTGMTSTVLLVERTAEALPTTDDIPFIVICLCVIMM
jgi:hypothetical protein